MVAVGADLDDVGLRPAGQPRERRGPLRRQRREPFAHPAVARIHQHLGTRLRVPEAHEARGGPLALAVYLSFTNAIGGSLHGKWIDVYVNTILRLRVKDATAGFKAWRAETLRKIDVSSIQSNGYAFQVEMNYRTVKHGMRIVEVPIRFEERADGVSKMSLAVQLESALVPWKLLLGRKLS